MRFAGLRSVILVFTLAAAVATTAAQEQVLYRSLCIDIPIVIDLPRIRVPVGCEVIDCCPGCPGPPPLDWRINVQGERLQTVTLALEEPALPAWKSIRVSGAGQLKADHVILGRGQTEIRGLLGDPKHPLVFSFASANLAKGKAALPTREAQAMAADRADAGEARVEIQQLLRGSVINRFTVIFQLRWCGFPPPLPTDKIEYCGTNTSGDNTIVLLDARRPSGCVNDEVDRGVGPVVLGDVRSSAGCRSEVAVFSDDNAMWFQQNVSVWTDSLGDILHADLGPLVNAPLDVWVMEGTFANTQARVNADVARANQLYNTMNCGIRTTATIHDATADPDTPNLLNENCGKIGDFNSKIGFTAGRLNVYYVGDPGARGWWCGTGSNTILVGTGADNESLSHEMGHAFSLGHTNGVAGFGTNNLMISGGTNRDQITIGQGFRCNLNPGSTLNSNGERTGTTRICPDATTSDACPALSLDVTPR